MKQVLFFMLCMYAIVFNACRKEVIKEEPDKKPDKIYVDYPVPENYYSLYMPMGVVDKKIKYIYKDIISGKIDTIDISGPHRGFYGGYTYDGIIYHRYGLSFANMEFKDAGKLKLHIERDIRVTAVDTYRLQFTRDYPTATIPMFTLFTTKNNTIFFEKTLSKRVDISYYEYNYKVQEKNYDTVLVLGIKNSYELFFARNIGLIRYKMSNYKDYQLLE